MTKIDVLDKGFIELVDVLGSDLTVVNAARVSFGKRKTELDSSDEKLIKYLANHEHHSPFRNCQIQFNCKVPEFVARQWYKHCYSKDTEVYTDSGWKLFSELTGFDSVAQVSEDGLTFNFVRPTDYICNKYVGDMHVYKTRTVSLCVTPEHRMIVHKRKKSKTTDSWTEEQVVLSKDVIKGGEYKLPTLPTFMFKDEGTVDDYNFGVFYGFYLGDGNSSSSSNRLTFTVKKQRKIDVLKNLTSSVELANVTVTEKQDGYSVFRCDNPNKELFSGICTDNSKQLNLQWVLQNKNRAMGVLKGLLESDGTQLAGKSVRFASSQQNIVDAVQELCVHLGVDTSLWSGGDRVFNLTLKQNTNKHLFKRGQSITPYDGYVYCVTVPSGKLLVRHDGIVSVCGNCIGAEYSIGSKDHGWNEISGRYVDANEFDFYIPTEYRKQSKSNKQCSTDELVTGAVDCYGTSFIDLNGWGKEYTEGDEVIPDAVYPQDIVQNVTDMCMEAYNLLIKHGVAKEQARMILPLNFYTEFYWTASLQAVCNFIKLRDHEGSQYEIRQYAKAMKELVEEKFPISLKYLLG